MSTGTFFPQLNRSVTVQKQIFTCPSGKRRTVMLGCHAIIECYGKQAFLSTEQLEMLMRKAANAAGATVLGVKVHDFGEGLGNTGVLMLAESHISVHTWPEFGYAAFDVFMCGEADVKKAVEVISYADSESRCTTQLIQRGPRPELSSVHKLPEIQS